MERHSPIRVWRARNPQQSVQWTVVEIQIASRSRGPAWPAAATRTLGVPLRNLLHLTQRRPAAEVARRGLLEVWAWRRSQAGRPHYSAALRRVVHLSNSNAITWSINALLVTRPRASRWTLPVRRCVPARGLAASMATQVVASSRGNTASLCKQLYSPCWRSWGLLPWQPVAVQDKRSAAV
jgi:hypothetical protein